MPFAKRNNSLVVCVRVALDVCWITVAYLLSVLLTFPDGQTWLAYAYAQLSYLLVFVVVWCAAAIDLGLFASRRSETLVAVLFSVAKSLFAAFLFTGFLLALLAREGVDRRFFLVFGASALFTALVYTLATRPTLWNLRRRGYNFRQILVIGANKRTAHLVEVFLANEQYGYHIIGFLEDDPERAAILSQYSIPCLGRIEELDRILVNQVIDGVYISLPVRSFYTTIERVAHLCEGVGVPVRLLADLFPVRLASSDVTRVADIPLLSLAVEPEFPSRFALKRAVDRLASLILLTVMSPLLLLIAVLIKLDSKGPIFISQERLGQRLRPFKMLTFRVTADRGESAGSVTGAPPLTHVGRFLHRYGLDELPQFVNVLLGQMSLTGPRPPVRSQDNDEEEPLEEPAAPPEATVVARAFRGRRAVSLAALAALDGLCIVLAYAVAISLIAPARAVIPDSLVNNLPYLGVFVLVWFGAAVDRRMWNRRANEGLVLFPSALGEAVGTAAVFCVFLMALLTPEGVPREFLVTFCATTLISLFVLRLVQRLVFLQIWRIGYDLRQVLVLGANERAARLLDSFGPRGQHGYRLLGFLEDDPARAAELARLGLSHLGSLGGLDGVLAQYPVDEVYIALPLRSHYETIRKAAERCEWTGVPAHLVADLFPLQIANRRIMHIEDIPVLSLSAIPEARLQLAFKRLLDFVVSTLMLVGLFPVFLVVAILIKLDSKGPIFYSQERVGQNERRFRILKFRSMIVNADELRAALEAQNEADGPVFKIRNDPRITRVGRYLRKFSLDEFPQLFNVWWGQMSLVGPRPPIPSEVEQYTWNQRRRLSVKPGMTGLWQVSGRSEVSFTQWVEMDLAYIDSWSLAQDLMILLKTFKAVVSARGAA